ncbi:hypothetical protein SEVIR_2G152400v4 [Setaria viridis]|uniref:Uncharacterized protein n=1 Tax=Setaria viridis TaxID=4556 RepID=A0A4U6W3W7_SETVI|nr:hypothetical protein SEVIR_2G152400v2 [Setaria viridis]
MRLQHTYWQLHHGRPENRVQPFYSLCCWCGCRPQVAHRHDARDRHATATLPGASCGRAAHPHSLLRLTLPAAVAGQVAFLADAATRERADRLPLPPCQAPLPSSSPLRQDEPAGPPLSGRIWRPTGAICCCPYRLSSGSEARRPIGFEFQGYLFVRVSWSIHKTYYMAHGNVNRSKQWI